MDDKGHYKISLFGLVVAACTALISCERAPADYEQLRAENERLKRQVELLSHGADQPEGSNSDPATVVKLSLKELWSRRFEDTKLRAKTSLDQKTLRVTGNVETVRDRSLALYGNTTRFGRMKMEVQLEENYASSIQDGLAALQRGIPVTVEGKFVYESMWLTDAAFVDSVSGRRLGSSELADLAEASKTAASNEPAGSGISELELKTSSRQQR